MKVVKEQKLNESKEKLPISFLTDFVSRGWDDVGYLKETIKSISESFSGTKKVEELLQALVDAYLVCIGQLEMHLQAKDYLDTELGEKLEEDLEIKINDEGDVQVKADPDAVVAVDQNEEVCVGPDCEVPPVEANIPPVEEPVEDEPISDDPLDKPFDFDAPEADGVRKFEKPEVADFFVDFDDPVGEPVTEKELYGEGEEPIEGEKIDADVEEEE